MKDFHLSTTLIPLVALLALAFPVATTLLPTTKPATPTPTDTSRAGNTIGGQVQSSKLPITLKPSLNAKALVCEFSTSPKEACLPCWQGNDCNPELGAIRQIETLIATIPDPKDSNFDYVFDQYLESIQRALETVGYTFDRYDLPWIGPREERKDDSKTRYKEMPGVILFRKNAPLQNEINQQSDLLLLFLVGEMPTAGIHKTALYNTLTQINSLPKKTLETSQEIRILGPTFSGSATSLAIALRDWLAHASNTTFNLISGSATAINKAAFLQQIGKPAQVQFHATVTFGPNDLEVFINEYLKKLTENSGKTSLRIAVLREANTGYGQGMSPKQTAKDAKATQDHQPQNNSTQQSATSILELTFPLHISKLRAAAEKNKTSSHNAVSPLSSSSNSNVALPMDEHEEPRDVVPMFSELNTAALDLVLSDLLTTINRERIDYLGIVASDVQDRIFLLREARAHCPNLSLFTLSSDILYLHPEASPEFRGMLVVSPYPLFNPNQLWTYPFIGNRQRLQFSLPNSLGTYNATLALLRYERALLEYGSPFNLTSINNRKPALWVSVVGRDRLWPIKTLPLQDPQEYVWSPQPNAQWQPPSYELVRETFAKLPATMAIEESQPQKEYREPAEIIVRLPTMLSGVFSSKTSILVLLGLSVLCCVPSLVLITQLLSNQATRNLNPWVTWLQNASVPQNESANRFAVWLGQSRFAPQISRPIYPSRIPVVRWFYSDAVKRVIDSLPFASIFSDPVLDDPNLKFKRRCYQLACCLILQATSFAVNMVYLMPIIATMKLVQMTDGAAKVPAWEIFWLVIKGAFQQYRVAPGLALCVFIINLLATTWLTLSLLDWLRGNLFEQLQKISWASKLLKKTDSKALPLWQTALSIAVLIILKWRVLPATVLGTFFTVSYGANLWGVQTASYASIEKRPAEQDIFLFLRATDLTGGLSPLLPLLFVGLAAFLAFFSALRRLQLFERICSDPQANRFPTLPFLNFEHNQSASFKGLRKLELELKSLLRCSFLKLNGSIPLILIILGMSFYLFRVRLNPTVEGKIFDTTFCVIFSLTTLVLAYAFWRFFWIWHTLRKMLHRLSWHPLFTDGASEICKKLPKIDLTSPMPAYCSMSFSVEQAHKLTSPTAPELNALANSADTILLSAHGAQSLSDWRTSLLYRVGTQKILADMSAHIAEKIEPYWQSKSAPPALEHEWQTEAKIFLASRVSSFLHYIFQQLQNLVGLVTAGLLLMLLAISSYPFQPRELLILFSWAIVLIVVGTTLFIFVQMSRDNVLSLLSGTEPGQLTLSRDFVFRVLLHGVIPIMALLGAQFPNTIRQLFGWIGALQGGGH